MSIRVEWYSTFCDFRKRAHCCRSVTFVSVQFRKIVKFCHTNSAFTRSKVFSLVLSEESTKLIFYQRSLQNSYFLKICKYLPFTLKSNRPKENSKWKETLKTSWVTVIFFFKNHSTLLYMEVSAPPPSPREDKKLLWRCPSNRWLTATLSSPTIFHFLHYTVYSIQYTVHSIQHTVHSTH